MNDKNEIENEYIILRMSLTTQESTMKTIRLALSFAMVMIFSGCDEFIASFFGGAQTQPITAYPLHIGNTWQYTRHMQSYNFRPLVPGAIDPHMNYQLEYVVEVTGEQRMQRVPSLSADSITVSEIRERDGMQPQTNSYVYLEQQTNALYRHGYAGATSSTPRPPAAGATRFLLAGHMFSSLDEMTRLFVDGLVSDHPDTLVRDYPPLTSIKYPLRNGDQWTFRPTGRPWRIDKTTGPMISSRVLGTSVRYHNVRWLYDMNNDGVWDNFISITDQISNKGMLKRTITFKDIVISDESHPEGIGKIDVKDEYVVTLMNVR